MCGWGRRGEERREGEGEGSGRKGTGCGGRGGGRRTKSRGVVAGEGLLNGGIKPRIKKKKRLTHAHTTHTPLPLHLRELRLRSPPACAHGLKPTCSLSSGTHTLHGPQVIGSVVHKWPPRPPLASRDPTRRNCAVPQRAWPRGNDPAARARAAGPGCQRVERRGAGPGRLEASDASQCDRGRDGIGGTAWWSLVSGLGSRVEEERRGGRTRRRRTRLLPLL